ncbi:aminotransferase class V-fold PLP-dependent enzyme [Bacillus sp. AK031]
MNTDSLHYKIATEPEEFNQIHRLNYQTFVDEIPQHQRNEKEMLVDRFHHENTYIIAKNNAVLAGMIAVRGSRPFSLDQKLADIDSFLPEGSVPCEIRLLAVRKEYRSSIIFYKLVEKAVSHCLAKGYNLALISGTVLQLKLYKRIGFVPFGPLVGDEAARFQPMYLTKDSFETSTKAFKRLMERNSTKEPVNFLPGPVPVRKEVETAFSKRAISHRSTGFVSEMEEVREKLKRITGARYVQVLVGTGTLSNDLVAAQLKKRNERGIILANGEFGSRLIDHAERMGLLFDVYEKEWNEPIGNEEVDHYLDLHPGVAWLWTVHCETSTGYLFDIEGLEKICMKHGVELCVDACSSAGVVPMDLRNVYMATTVSGKGLGSYPGLAILFHRDPMNPDPSLPRYLDLGMYQLHGSVPYTHSSNLVAALRMALNCLDETKSSRLSQIVKDSLSNAGVEYLGDEYYSPGIVSIPLPPLLSSKEFGDSLKQKGVLLSYESEYLLKRNWVQVALMGNYDHNEVQSAINLFLKELRSHKLSEVPTL